MIAMTKYCDRILPAPVWTPGEAWIHNGRTSEGRKISFGSAAIYMETRHFPPPPHKGFGLSGTFVATGLG